MLEALEDLLPLLRRDARGYLWSTVLAVMLALIGAMVIGQTVMQLGVGVQFTPGVLIGMVGSWVVMGTAAVWLAAAALRSVSPEKGRPAKESPANGFRLPDGIDEKKVAELTAPGNGAMPPYPPR